MWQNRLIKSGTAAPSELKFHPDNPKIHSDRQSNAIQAAIEELGWMGNIKINLRDQSEWGERRGDAVIIDGHDRVNVAIAAGEESVPVDYYSLSPNEERVFLLTFDPIGSMFSHDRERYIALHEEIEESESELFQYIQEEAEAMGIIDHQYYEELWEGMPEYDDTDSTGEHRVVKVRFQNEDDVNEFFRLINQSFTPQTKSIWYPYREPDRLRDERY